MARLQSFVKEILIGQKLVRLLLLSIGETVTSHVETQTILTSTYVYL